MLAKCSASCSSPAAMASLLETIRTGLAHKEFLDHCQESLRLFRHQNDLLLSVRARHPGLIPDADLYEPVLSAPTGPLLSTASLNGTIAHEIARASGLHRALPSAAHGAGGSMPHLPTASS